MFKQGQGEGDRIHLLLRDGKVPRTSETRDMAVVFGKNTTFDLLDVDFVSQFTNKMFSTYEAVSTCAVVIAEHVKCAKDCIVLG